MTKLLREKGVVLQSKAIDKHQIDERPLTVLEAMQELAEVKAMAVKLRENLVWVSNDIKGNASLLLKAIGAPIPPKLLKHASPIGSTPSSKMEWHTRFYFSQVIILK